MTIVAKNVCWRSRQFGTSAEVSARHFSTVAELSDTSAPVGWCRNVLGLKCRDNCVTVSVCGHSRGRLS